MLYNSPLNIIEFSHMFPTKIVTLSIFTPVAYRLEIFLNKNLLT